MTSVVVPHSPASVWQVRHRLVEELAASQVPADVLDDAALVVSELVGNAVRHGAPLRDAGGIVVDWRLDRGALVLEVRDGGGGPAPQAGPAAWTAEGGRGLLLVQLLSRHWETTPLPTGGTGVRAELPLAAEGEPSAERVCA